MMDDEITAWWCHRPSLLYCYQTTRQHYCYSHSLTRVPSAFNHSGGFSDTRSLGILSLSRASHASFSPTASHLPPSSFRAAANTSRLRARSSRSLCQSDSPRRAATLRPGPVVRAHMTCCWRAQEPHVASSCLPSPAEQLLPALAPHQLPLTISIVTVSERCSCSSVCR